MQRAKEALDFYMCKVFIHFEVHLCLKSCAILAYACACVGGSALPYLLCASLSWKMWNIQSCLHVCGCSFIWRSDNIITVFRLAEMRKLLVFVFMWRGEGGRHIHIFIYMPLAIQVDCGHMHVYRYLDVNVGVHLHIAIWLHLDIHTRVVLSNGHWVVERNQDNGKDWGRGEGRGILGLRVLSLVFVTVHEHKIFRSG